MDQNGWATALDQYWGDFQPGSRALLMLEQSVLCNVAACIGKRFESPEEAEDCFVEVVKAYLLAKSHRTWYAEPYHPDRPPRFLLQVGIQVYAASKMQADESGHYSERAYHVQLDTLLGDSLSRRRFNLNAQADFHQELWRTRLMEWVAEKQLRLTLPVDRPGHNRDHVGLPLSQMVLRASDIQRLPAFFSKAGFRPSDQRLKDPRDEVQLARIPSELQRLRSDRSCFSGWAVNVLSDEYKFNVAVHQVEEGLRTWDGRLWLSPVRNRANVGKRELRGIWLVVRTSRGYLKAVGGETLASARRIDTNDLAEVFAGRVVGKNCLEVREGLALFRYDDEDAAFKDSSFVDAGDRGMLVFGPSFRGKTDAWLSAQSIYSSPRFYAAEEIEGCAILDGIPEGCFLFEFRIADTLPPVDQIPELWRLFLRLPAAGLSLSGGLRVGQKEQFVAGAGPQLRISGSCLPAFISVDGERIEISSRAVRLDQFSLPGKHEIVASIDGKHHRKSFEVLHPESVLTDEFPPRAWAFEAGRWPIWERLSGSHGGQEPKEGAEATLFGVRGLGMRASKVAQLSVDEERLVAVQLLAGLSFAEGTEVRTSHPLVRHLLDNSLKLKEVE